MSLETPENRASTVSDGIEVLDACPLCESQASKALPTPGRWIGAGVFGGLKGRIGLMRCLGCGLVFINPRPSIERLTTFYSGDTYCCHSATGSASAGAKADYLLNRIAENLPSDVPRTLLDYGAGGGGFLLHARTDGWEVLGFEPGRRGLESCRLAGLEVTDNLEELPTKYFGVVTLHHVFEHVTDPFAALAGIRKHLAINGRLFIEVPNANSLRARLALPVLSSRLSIDERYRAFPIHLIYYNDRTLRRMLAKAGWIVEAAFTVGLGLDEFFIRSERSSASATLSSGHKTAQPRPGRRLRHLMRDVFLNQGLGENLAMIARSRE